MTEPGNTSEGPDRLADQVAEVVLGHPSVLRLSGGDHGIITTHLPGRQVTGVRAGDIGQPVEIGVVLRLDRPLPEIVTELRTRAQTVAGAVRVDISIRDVVTDAEYQEERQSSGGSGEGSAP